MLLFLLIIIVGGSYLYYRFHSITDKRRFFGSPLFLSVSGSLGILLISVAFVNTIKPQAHLEPTLQSDSIFVDEIDTARIRLLAKPASFHFDLISKILGKDGYTSRLSVFEEKYYAFTQAADPYAVSLGNFCLGVIRMKIGEDEKAQEHLNKVLDNNFPYLHFCKAEILLKRKKNTEAAAEYTFELQNERGNRIPSFIALLQYYTEERNFDKLHELLQYPEADGLVPDDLARGTLLRTGDFLSYPLWLGKMLIRKTHILGFIAAFLIALMWLIYLFRLDIFKPEKFISLLALLAGGMLSVPFVFLFTDIADLFTNWSLNGGFFNDLLFSIVMIGIPEELAKASPLLLLIVFRKYLHEPIDYIIYGCASALGFAFVENLLYFQEIDGGIIHGRAYLSVIGHMADTSFIAYGFVIARYQLNNNRKLWYVFPLSFLAACTVHGIYDFFLFQEMILFFFIFFILIVQVWLIMINNCMNNSSHFSYTLAPQAEKSRIFITLALTTIFALEYIAVAFISGDKNANAELLSNTAFAGFLIIFFSSNLGSFDLIKGYWRNVRMKHREKRGYGNRQRLHPLISWYFVNASQSHNYVGLRVNVFTDPRNKILVDILPYPYEGQIVNRITLYDEGDEDPHWFLVKMTVHLPFAEARPDYILVKLRYSEDSLRYEDEVEVHFRAITNAAVLREPRPEKKYFPFYGWAWISMKAYPEPSPHVN